MFRRLAAVTIASVMLAGSLLPAGAPPPHPALARGLALMREGDFEAAVLELDAAVRKIESDPAAGAHRAWAYVHLGVAYLELEQEAVARGKFREALARDPGLQLLPAEFSAQSIRVFEDVRAEAAAAAASAPVRDARPRPVTPTTPPSEKKGSKGALVAVLVGGAAAAGAAVALGGGGGGGDPGTATTTTPIGGGSTTLPGPSPSPEPPATTLPGTPPTTTPGTPTTTTPGTPTTTTPGPTTTTTQPPSTTLPPSCAYDVSGQVNVSAAGCMGCMCSVSAAPSSCRWNARASDTNMITITQGSGTGSGNVIFNVSASVSQRTGRITLAEGGGTCTVSQNLLFGPTDAAGWNALLVLEGGAGQITINGSQGTYQSAGVVALEAPHGFSRVEALVVTAAGRPGTWRFQLPAAAKAGSLRIVAGDVAAIAAGTVTFRLAGRPGERLVFTFALR